MEKKVTRNTKQSTWKKREPFQSVYFMMLDGYCWMILQISQKPTHWDFISGERYKKKGTRNEQHRITNVFYVNVKRIIHTYKYIFVHSHCLRPKVFLIHFIVLQYQKLFE